MWAWCDRTLDPWAQPNQPLQFGVSGSAGFSADRAHSCQRGGHGLAAAPLVRSGLFLGPGAFLLIAVLFGLARESSGWNRAQT